MSNVVTEKIAHNFGGPLKLHSVLILPGTVASNIPFVARAWWWTLVDYCNFGAIVLYVLKSMH